MGAGACASRGLGCAAAVRSVRARPIRRHASAPTLCGRRRAPPRGDAARKPTAATAVGGGTFELMHITSGGESLADVARLHNAHEPDVLAANPHMAAAAAAAAASRRGSGEHGYGVRGSPGPGAMLDAQLPRGHYAVRVPVPRAALAAGDAPLLLSTPTGGFEGSRIASSESSMAVAAHGGCSRPLASLQCCQPGIATIPGAAVSVVGAAVTIFALLHTAARAGRVLVRPWGSHRVDREAPDERPRGTYDPSAAQRLYMSERVTSALAADGDCEASQHASKQRAGDPRSTSSAASKCLDDGADAHLRATGEQRRALQREAKQEQQLLREQRRELWMHSEQQHDPESTVAASSGDDGDTNKPSSADDLYTGRLCARSKEEYARFVRSATGPARVEAVRWWNKADPIIRP